MSKLYHIQLKTTVSRQIDASDCVTYPIALTEILPESDMLDLFRTALLAKGWIQQPDGTLTNTGHAGEILTVDLEKKTLHAALVSSKTVSSEAIVDQDIDAWDHKQAQEHGKALLNDKVKNVESRLQEQKARLQQELTQALLDSEQQRMQLVNEAIQDVYRDALTRKAEQLGELTSINESTNANGEYELIIKVSQ